MDEAATALLVSSLRSASPLLLVLLGETISQRVGIINLGVEGEMLMGAFAGFAVAAATGDPWLALFIGAIAGAALSLVHAGLVLGAGANQLGSGIALWILAIGITSFYGRSFVGSDIQGLGTLAQWGLDQLPLIGSALGQLTPTVLAGLLLWPGISLWLHHTRTGLRWKAVGEDPDAARAHGIRPRLVQCQAIVLGGLLAGLGGAALSVDYTLTWAQEMTKGRGLLAVGLVIVARWNPWLVFPAALIFGFGESLYLRLQVAGVALSPHLLAMLPYLICLAVIIIAQASDRHGVAMPAGLRAVFRRTS